jgi:hypothetical protein
MADQKLKNWVKSLLVPPCLGEALRRGALINTDGFERRYYPGKK